MHTAASNLTMKKKLLYIIGTLDLGGAETHLSQILPKLKAKYDVSVCVLSKRGILAETLENQGVIVFGPVCIPVMQQLRKNIDLTKRTFYGSLLSYLDLSFGVVRLVRLIRKMRPDIIHYFLPTAYVVGGISAFFTGQKKQVMSRRSLNYYQNERRWMAVLEKWLHKRMNLVLGNSARVIQQLAEENIPHEKLRLIYNGVDLQRFPKKVNKLLVRLQFNLPQDALILMVVANLFPYKGHLDLLEALGQIKNNMPANWRLICVGRDAGMLPALKQKSEKLGLVENILWLGQRRDIPDLLSAADIGLLCSHEEGFSNAIIEGMAAGLPMVVTDVGGNVEAVIHDDTGLVVPPQRPEALASAILKLLSDEGLRKRMGARGCARIKEHFSLESCVNVYEKMYESI